ncbi:hypothetical protein HAX54_045780, partial [Datura stramonium]|nr:hypothetical protein [Datura stramonium]
MGSLSRVTIWFYVRVVTPFQPWLRFSILSKMMAILLKVLSMKHPLAALLEMDYVKASNLEEPVVVVKNKIPKGFRREIPQGIER